MEKIKQNWSILVNKHTNLFIVLTIIIINILLIILSGIILNALFPTYFEDIYNAFFICFQMVIDPGFLPVDGGTVLTLVAVFVVIFGMIIFAGGIIGYAANLIGTYMEAVKTGNKKLYLSNHLLIINWNSRAVEIIAEEMYKGNSNNILVFVSQNRDSIKEEIQNKLFEVKDENRKIGKVNVFVKEGDPFSFKDLTDMGVQRAHSIIILDNDAYNYVKSTDKNIHVNTTPIKILMLLSQLKLSQEQTIIIESSNKWTSELISDIMEKSEDDIVPLLADQILGRITGQSAMMPELNLIYNEVMSHKGKEFYAFPTEFTLGDEAKAIESYLQNHNHGVPLSIMETEDGNMLYVMGEEQTRARETCQYQYQDVSLEVNDHYKYEHKNILILGKNSNQQYIFDTFQDFRTEHGDVVHIDLITTDEGLEMSNDEAYVSKHMIQSEFDYEGMSQVVGKLLSEKKINTILILSDDLVLKDNQDSISLVYLIYIQKILSNHKALAYKPDIIVELLNPRHFDIASQYSVDNVIISNRYVSKLITQIGDNRDLFVFFQDLLSYDTNTEEIAKEKFDSKEIYIKLASEFYTKMPEICSAKDLVVATYQKSPKDNRSILLGYIRPFISDEESGKDVFNGEGEEARGGRLVLFGNHMDQQAISLKPTDKLVIFSNH